MSGQSPTQGNPITIQPVVDQFNGNMHLTHAFLADLARNLFDPKEICARYGLTQAEAKKLLLKSGMYNLYLQHKAAWASDQNANVRIRQKGLLLIELVIEEIGKRLLDPNTTPAQINDLMNALVKALNAANPPAVAGQGGTGNSYSVTINLGGQTTRITAPSYGVIEAQAEPEEAAA